MKKVDFSRLVPPGYDWKAEQRALLWGLGGAFGWSLSYGVRLRDAWEMLHRKTGSGWILRDGAMMESYVTVLGLSLIGFPILALQMVSYMISHMVYLRQGSKSIWLMRRLPDPRERHIRCLALPLLYAAVALAVGFLLLLLYYWIYLAVIPDGCLMPDQWQNLWRVKP